MPTLQAAYPHLPTLASQIEARQGAIPPTTGFTRGTGAAADNRLAAPRKTPAAGSDISQPMSDTTICTSAGKP